MYTRRQFIATAAGLAVASTGPFCTAADKPRIKIGQIGTGHAHASGKMAVYRASKDFEVVGLAEPDAKRRAFAARSRVYNDVPLVTVEQLLNTPGLQAVAIETEVKDLLRSAEVCVDAGMHIHLDKPPGASLPIFKRILAKADAAKRFVQLGYMYRFNPAVQFMRDCLKKGWLGEPYAVHTVMGKVLSSSARKRIAAYPGGIMYELGCHVIDLAVLVLGKPDRVSAFPRASRKAKGDLFPDNMLAVLETEGATASVRASAIEVEGFARRHFVVSGTEGTCHIQPLDRPSIRLALSRGRGDYRKGYQDVPFEPPYRRYVGDAVDFAAMIRNEKDNDFPTSHELAVQEAVLLASGMPLTGGDRQKPDGQGGRSK